MAELWGTPFQGVAALSHAVGERGNVWSLEGAECSHLRAGAGWAQGQQRALRSPGLWKSWTVAWPGSLCKFVCQTPTLAGHVASALRSRLYCLSTI